jgi:NAD(P)-dependent dehydrogenase (short-subunit alcohol dehydrogenase family)
MVTTDPLFDVSGLAVIVTGAASGLGLAYSEVLAERGARVTLLDIDEAALDRQVTRLRAAGCDVRGVVVNVADRAALRKAVDEAATYYGALDVVFANAGIDSPPGFLSRTGEREQAGAFENVSDESWDRVIAVNLTGIFVTIRAAIPHLKRSRNARIIVTTSGAAFRPAPAVGLPYMPAKAGAAHLVRQAALELARYGILVNAIAPGPFATHIAGGQMQDSAMRNASASRLPLHRMADPEEIKGLVLFLASPASRYVTGAQMVIDGGLSLGPAD